jgi:hypothetical protein
MSNTNGDWPEPWQVALEFIKVFSVEERRKFIKALANRPWLTPDHTVGPSEIIDFMMRTSVEGIKLLYKFGPRFSRRERCAQVKKQRLLRRHAEIRDLEAAGIVEPLCVLNHLKEHHPELVRKGSRDWVDAERMMRRYRESQGT